MHMADGLISPAVGAAMWAATAATGALSLKTIAARHDVHRLPLMGVAGAFVFAAQMINFSIPGTGSSGHLGGGLMLAALLGPQAGFLVMATILGVQALFFADGGLLAYGCNVYNLGFFTCFVAYPLIFKPLVRRSSGTGSLAAASLAAAVVGLQLGAFSVVVETLLSGRTELPFGTFALMMLPVHLAIGVVEGLVTGAVLVATHRVRPEVLEGPLGDRPSQGRPLTPVLLGGILLTLVAGGLLSWFASSKPDGLEWSIARISGRDALEAGSRVHDTLATLQEWTAILPDYSPRVAGAAPATDVITSAESGEPAAAWPSVSAGTSLSGVLGALMVFAFVAVAGLLARVFRKQRKGADS